VQYGPVGPQWVPDAHLQAIARASAETGRRVHMHLLETKRQREWADAHYPGGLLPHLDRMGLLSPRLTVAHAVWLRPDEAALLAERGVTVSLNPSSNLRLRSGLTPGALLQRSGVRYGIGLDGMSLDDDEDMLREIRLLRHLSNLAAPGEVEEVLPVSALFDAAIKAGRCSILGDDGGGALAVGAPADMLLLDLDLLVLDALGEEPDLVDLLLTRMSRRHVSQLIVGGQTIVRDGRCITVDRPALEAALLAEARAGRDRHRPDFAAMQDQERAVAGFYASCHHLLPELEGDTGKKHHHGNGDGDRVRNDALRTRRDL